MTGPKFPRDCRFVLLLFLLISDARLFGASNEIVWNYINLPATGTVDQTIYFSASVTNTGEAVWEGNHYLELGDQNGIHLNYIALGRTDPGNTRSATLALKLPGVPGKRTYHFTALQHGTDYFGPTIVRTIVGPK